MTKLLNDKLMFNKFAVFNFVHSAVGHSGVLCVFRRFRVAYIPVMVITAPIVIIVIVVSVWVAVAVIVVTVVSTPIISVMVSIVSITSVRIISSI